MIPKMAAVILFVWLVISTLCLNVSLADRTSLKIYEKIQANHFCFRRMNATHQIGCSSRQGGNVGVVHLVEQLEDIEWIVKSGPYPPYIAVLPISFFNKDNMKKLHSSDRVAGVMVLKPNGEDIPSIYSPEQSCPNENFGLYSDIQMYAKCSKVKWNKVKEDTNPVLGMMYEDWGMPIFLITEDESIKKIKDDCYVKFNQAKDGIARSWPLCSARLKSNMLGAKDTSTCMRRSNLVTNLNPAKLCDPLGGQNIITTLFPKTSFDDDISRSLIIVGARLDAFSMYDNLAPGGHSAVTGLVTFLSCAHSLAKLREQMKSEILDKARNVLFALFNGEAFDYIGSSRMVYDMKKGNFPPDHEKKNFLSYSLEHVSHFIELSQLVPNDKIFLHVDPVSTRVKNVNSTVNELINELLNQAASVFDNTTISMVEAEWEIPLPPASVQSFLKYNKNISSVVIADHKEEYINKYYNSLYDDARTLGIHNDDKLVTNLANISAVLTRTLYKMLTGKSCSVENCSIEPDTELIKELLNCYLVNATCDLFQMILPDKLDKLNDDPYPLYIGVEPSTHIITLCTQYLFSYLTGEQLVGVTRQNCSNNRNEKLYQYYWMPGPNLTGICVKSTVISTTAVSPAFLLEDWNSREYSTWTESVWEEPSAMIFLQPSLAKEIITLVIGCIISILSFIIVYFANKRASILFGARNLVGC